MVEGKRDCPIRERPARAPKRKDNELLKVPFSRENGFIDYGALETPA